VLEPSETGRVVGITVSVCEWLWCGGGGGSPGLRAAGIGVTDCSRSASILWGSAEPFGVVPLRVNMVVPRSRRYEQIRAVR
jgi:hypothetical protein